MLKVIVGKMQTKISKAWEGAGVGRGTWVGRGSPLIKNYEMSISCSLEDIDPIFNNKCPFHVLFFF